MTNWRIGKIDGKDRIWIELPFPHKDALKNGVPGVRWDAKQKYWHAPMDWEVCRDIRRVAQQCGCGLTVMPSLVPWAKAQRQRIDKLVSPMAFDDPDTLSQMLPRTRAIHPDLIEAMMHKPWQIPGAQFIADQRRALLADQPGLGKTLQTLAAVTELELMGPILVIAPKSAVEVTWPEEIERWLGEPVKVIGADLKPAERRAEIGWLATQQQRFNMSYREWYIMEYSYMRIEADVDDYGNFVRDEKRRKIIRAVNHTIPELFAVNWSGMIVDESHKLTAGGSPGVGKRRWSAQRLGLDALTIVPGGMRVAVSGTPFRGKTENIWGTLQWLDPNRFTSYWNFVKRHYGIVDDHNDSYGAGIVKGDNVLDEERFYKELKPYMVRRMKSDVAPWLPPKDYSPNKPLDPSDPDSPRAVWLPMTPKQKKQYDQIIKDALINLDGLDQISISGALAEMVRFKQVANSALGPGAAPIMPSNKIDWVVQFLVDRQVSGIKTLVASQFTQFLELLSNELDRKGISHYLLTGKTSGKKRKSMRSEFQSDEGDNVFLVNTMAGGSSLTLDYADDVVICDQTYIPDDQEQVEDRAHRPAGDRIHNVTIWYLASIGTIDEDMAVLNTERQQAIMNIIDGQRSADYAKRLIQMTQDRMKGKVA